MSRHLILHSAPHLVDVAVVVVTDQRPGRCGRGATSSRPGRALSPSAETDIEHQFRRCFVVFLFTMSIPTLP